MPIPEGWVHVIRGTRPKSEVWPRAKSGMPSQKVPQGGSNNQPGRGGILPGQIRARCAVSSLLFFR